MMTTIMALSEQIAQFQTLMLATQEKINKDIAEVKQEIQQISAEIKGIKETATQARKIAVENREQITELRKLTADLADRKRTANLIIHGISENIDQRNLEQSIVTWISGKRIELEKEQVERAHRLQSKRRGSEK